MHYFLTYKSIHIRVTGNSDSITEIKFLENSIENSEDIKLNSFWKQTLKQIKDYLCGNREELDFNISYDGTDFQLRVWAALKETSYGQTITYGELAKLVGSSGGARAIGGACNKNPLPLIIPCHRVVAANGLGGFAGGETAKYQLLSLENRAKIN